VLPEPAILAIGILVALLVLLPARRLHLAGFSSAVIGVYALGVWALAMILVFRPVLIRFLVPILVVLYLAPFVTAPGRMSAIVRRGRGPRGGGRGDSRRPPMKNVTPPDGPHVPPGPPGPG
jgi:hypothetical protein